MSKEVVTKDLKAVLLSVLGGLIVVSFGYYAYYGPSKNKPSGLEIQKEGGLFYLVDPETGEKVSDGFKSFENSGSNTSTGPLGEYKFIITVEDGQITSVSPESNAPENIDVEIATTTSSSTIDETATTTPDTSSDPGAIE